MADSCSMIVWFPKKVNIRLPAAGLYNIFLTTSLHDEHIIYDYIKLVSSLTVPPAMKI